VAVLAVRALGNENVKVLLLPSQYSSEHSINDALALANTLHIEHEIVNIAQANTAVEASLANAFSGLAFNVTEENIQARLRGLLLMAHSNKFGHVLLNTTNKSEAAVGYGTLYGDMCGGLAVLGDVYKTECYELANYINKDTVVIPTNTIVKPPSAELRPNQKDSDSLPDYDVLDAILRAYIEHCNSPEDIIAQGHDAALVNRVLGMVNRNEFKRFQMAPVLRVSPKAFGMGRRMPLEGKYKYV
ncbi:MAG: NAD(+) synthase, partial [Bacteroidia bacterium]